VDCATHEGTTAETSCAVCHRALCADCVAYDVNDEPTCERCGRLEEDRSRSLGSTLLVLTGLGYLVVLAIGFVVFRARPFIGGIAAIAAIALGRALQLALKPPVVIRRLRRT